MKALKEIGVLKALKFIIGELISVALNLCLLPPVRTAILRIMGAKIGEGCVIHNVKFMNFYRGTYRNLTIGDQCFIGQDCLLDLSSPIKIGNQVTFGPRVLVLTHLNVGFEDHPLQSEFPSQAIGVEIGHGSFIGASSTILDGVSIGQQCFLAAGAVAHKSIPNNTLVGGVPAIKIREITAGLSNTRID